MNEICPICQNDGGRILYELYDDRYGYPGLFQLRQCPVCLHKYLLNDFLEKDLTDLYTKFYPRRSFSVADFQPLLKPKGLRSWFKGEYRAYSQVPENVTVLDIGCGFCESIAYHQSRGCTVYGVEADENASKIANKFGFNVHIGVFDHTKYPNNFFDFVTMDQVIEHVKDPIETFSSIAKVLKIGGKLIITTPNSNGYGAFFYRQKWINWHAPYHLQHFSRNSIRKAAKMAGLKMTKIKTHTSSEWLFYQWMHSMAYPKQGKPSDFWRHETQLLAKKFPYGWRFYNKLHAFKVNDVITRLADAMNIGDNWLIHFEKIGNRIE